MAGKRKTEKQDEAAARAREEVGNVAEQLSSLATMTVAELKSQYKEVFGEPSRSSNKDYLRKKIAWRIQELAEGGLSDRAKQRIEELAADAPARFRQTVDPSQSTADHSLDPRLPTSGSVITKEHRGVTHEVKVLDDAFEYQGKTYRSLSKIAREITGTSWNGFLFFGLTQKRRRSAQ